MCLFFEPDSATELWIRMLEVMSGDMKNFFEIPYEADMNNVVYSWNVLFSRLLKENCNENIFNYRNF